MGAEKKDPAKQWRHRLARTFRSPSFNLDSWLQKGNRKGQFRIHLTLRCFKSPFSKKTTQNFFPFILWLAPAYHSQNRKRRNDCGYTEPFCGSFNCGSGGTPAVAEILALAMQADAQSQKQTCIWGIFQSLLQWLLCPLPYSAPVSILFGGPGPGCQGGWQTSVALSKTITSGWVH